MEKWAESLVPHIEKAREELRSRNPADVARASGSQWQAEGTECSLRIEFMGDAFVVPWPGLVVRDGSGRVCPTPAQALLLQYLRMADGTPIRNSWVSLRSLPNGAFYEQAFQSYSGNLLARKFEKDPDGFSRAALKAGGTPVDLGDLAFRFQVFPRIPLAVVFWSGGEEFRDSIQVLFDSSASHYNQLETLAYLGSLVCKRIGKMASPGP